MYSYFQSDLTEEIDSNLYVNPLDGGDKTGLRGMNSCGVKKSASGEIAHKALNVSPSAESLKEINMQAHHQQQLQHLPVARAIASAAHVAIVRTPLSDTIPKHRKSRVQQVRKENKNKTASCVHPPSLTRI